MSRQKVSVCLYLFVCHPPTTVSSALPRAGPTLALSGPGPGPGGGHLGAGATQGAHVAVLPTVTVATLPLHLRHHLVGRLVPGPHEGTVAGERHRDGSHVRISQ